MKAFWRTTPTWSWPHARLAGVVGLWLLLLRPLARADCECGYATNIRGYTEQQVFTDLLETDFTRVSNIALSPDWRRQAFNLTSERARGRYGEMFAVHNVRSNPDRDREGRSGTGYNGQPSGLELVVGSQRVSGMVPVAELDSSRMDILWGTFRVAMKLTDVPGTCGAFFWYHNDSQEIDMEFLSREFNKSSGSYPVNLVLQSREAAEAGYNAQATGNFQKVNLPFDPTQEFHEYRMDFLADKVVFYADGQVLAEMGGAAVPNQGGHLILQHWSNGNALWSGGPPERDAVLAVRYVRAYFNSSTAARQRDLESRCRDTSARGAVCQIPSTPDVRNPSFFSDTGSVTENQTMPSNAGPSHQPGGRSGSLSALVSSACLGVVAAALVMMG